MLKSAHVCGSYRRIGSSRPADLGGAESALWAVAALSLLYAPAAYLLRYARRKRDEKRRVEVLSRLKEVLRQDSRQAYDLFMEFRALGGKPAAFSAEEIYRVFSAAGRVEELAGQTGRFNEAQLIGIANLLARENKRLDAVRLLSNDPFLFSTLPSETACEEIIEIYEQAGKLKELVNDKLSIKPHEIVMAFANAFVRLGKPLDCIHLLDTMYFQKWLGRTFPPQT